MFPPKDTEETITVEVNSENKLNSENELLSSTIDQIGEFASEAQKRARDAEFKAVRLKSELDKSKKTNRLKKKELRSMKELTNEAIANATSVKHQLVDVKRAYKARIEELQTNLEITSKAKSAKSEVIMMAEAEVESLKSQLAESQKMNDVKSLEFNAMIQKMSIEAKGNATSLKFQLNEAKKMHEEEVQTLQKKLEDTAKSGYEAIQRAQKQKVEMEAIQKKLE